MIYDSTHIATGIDWLLVQSKGQTYIEGLLTAYLERVQNLEDAIYGLYANKILTTAAGVHLDRLGVIVGVGRGSLTDDQYRLRIGLQVFINSTNCSMSDIAYAIKRFYEIDVVTPVVLLQEVPNAHFVVYLNWIVDDWVQIYYLISAMKPAGVSFDLVYTLESLTFTGQQLVLTATEESDIDNGLSGELTDDQDDAACLAGAVRG